MASTINTVGYALYENRLTNRNGERTNFYARVLPRGRVTEADIVELIVLRNSTVTRQEVTAVMDLLNEVVKTSLRMGFTVNTRIFNASIAIHGVFDSMTDSFDPARHNMVLNLTPAKPIKDFVACITGIEKGDTTLPAPGLFSLLDYVSNDRNGRVTPGNIAELSGVNLQLDTQAADQGVYFTTEDDQAGLKAERIVSVCAKRIVFQVPAALAEGSYTVEVRRGFGSILRAARLAVPVVVPERTAA